jgi:hypothetical protein
MTEVRTVLWPTYETPEWSAAQFLQGIAGTLELFHRSTLSFRQIAGEATGHPVAVFQRIDQAGYMLPIDERILADADTLLVFGLDHLLSEQEAAPEEIAAIPLSRHPQLLPKGETFVRRSGVTAIFIASLGKWLAGSDAAIEPVSSSARYRWEVVGGPPRKTGMHADRRIQIALKAAHCVSYPAEV